MALGADPPCGARDWMTTVTASLDVATGAPGGPGLITRTWYGRPGTRLTGATADTLVPGATGSRGALGFSPALSPTAFHSAAPPARLVRARREA